MKVIFDCLIHDKIIKLYVSGYDVDYIIERILSSEIDRFHRERFLVHNFVRDSIEVYQNKMKC